MARRLLLKEDQLASTGNPPSGYQWIGYNGVTFSERQSDGDIIKIGNPRPYKVYTALLTQSGGDNEIEVTSGMTLEIGKTYYILSNPGEDNLTIFGAPNSQVGTYFVCTTSGVCPDGVFFTYNTGAPVVTVLENTIGNIWFNYEDVGIYGCQSNDLFTDGKTFISTTPTENAVSITVVNQSTAVKYISPLNNSLNAFDNGLFNTPIEIRVYN